jgi:signal transduction histidine kinase/ActR/RegA family two-component response regulator
MDPIESLKRILQRERAARKAAEELIERKSLELYEKNQELLLLNESLEAKIQERTAEIEASRQELLRAKERAEQADRAKSDFLSSMSHEIRTPLNSIIGLTEVIVSDSQDAVAIEYGQAIQSSAETLLGIINEILDFSKIEAGRISFEQADFSMGQVAESLRQTFRIAAERRGLQFQVQISPGVPDALRGDRLKLSQILINLVGNALKFTREGRVGLSCRAESLGEEGCVLLLSIQDSGIGIPAEKLGLIFEQFRQASSSTQREFGGTGLGLAITRRLVELQGGSIWVESEVGKGSTFWVRLPFAFASGQQEAPAEGPDPLANADLSSLSVLLVEDIAANRFVMEQILRRRQIRSDYAANGLIALEKLAQQRYDLVLMDLHMPVMDGMEATRRIRDASSPVLQHDIPIIALTADAFSEVREELLAVGMDDFLSKPVRMEELYRKLALYVRGKKG